MPVALIAAARVAALVGDFDRSPAYAGLAGALRQLVADGRVPVGVRLPSERDLTEALGVSRTTVTRAYDLLREERYLESRQGSGSVTRLPVSRHGRTDHVLIPRGSDEDSIDLTIATCAAPPGTAAAYARAVEALPAYLSGTGYYPTGLPALREALARRFDARGLPTRPEQLLVVPGALAGVAVAAQALLGVGDRVVTETPTYPNSILTLQRRGARLVPSAVDPEHGWDVDHLSAVLPGARAAYLVADFHNPTGTLMDPDQRVRIGAVLERSGTDLVVDESLVDLNLDGVAMPAPLGAFAASAWTVGSASKAFWGGLRIGWLRVPEGQVDRAVTARTSLDLACAPLEQLALLDLLDREEELLRERCHQLRLQRDALVSALREALPEWRLRVPQGGLFLWCQLPAPLSTTLAEAAEAHNLYLTAGRAFTPTGGLEHRLRLPFTLAPDRVHEAVRRLALAWTDALERGPASRRRSETRRPVVA